MSKRVRYNVWTPEQDEELRQRKAAGESAREIGQVMGLTMAQVNNRCTTLGVLWQHTATVRPVADYSPPTGPTFAEVFAPEASAEEEDDAFLARMLAGAGRSIAKAQGQRHARIRIASRDPVAISLWSDAHVSAHGTDLSALLEYARFVARTPNLYAIGIGDWLDNPIKHKGGSVGQIADDLRFLDLLTGEFKGKLLGTTSGNHDDWSKTLAGMDHLAALARRHRIHYAPDELLWKVEIVDPSDLDTVTATYRIHTRHQWRRGSALNPGHACWTWWQEEGPNWEVIPDVLAIGHNHVAVVEERSFEHRTMWAVRPGTFQKDSSFARAKGFGRYRHTTPAVVLPAMQGRVMCFSDPEDARTFMDGHAEQI